MKCENAIEHCIKCSDKETCLECYGDLVADGSHCSDRHIPGCKTASESDSSICTECNDFHELTSDGKRCINCMDFADGCTDCSLDAMELTVTSCESCLPGLELVGDHKCHMDHCYDWSLYRDDEGDAFAHCDVCNDFWGTTMEGNCARCPMDESWSDCIDCSFDEDGEPVDCLMCAHSKVLYEGEEEELPRTCDWPLLENCEIQDEETGKYCHKCDSGFTWNGEMCEDCNIPKCSKCYKFTMGEGAEEYVDCIECEPGYLITLSYLDEYRTIPKRMCDYQQESRMLHCLVTDLDDSNSCHACISGFYFDSDSSEC